MVKFDIFKYDNVYYYMINNEPQYGGIPLNEELDAPREFIRLVCTWSDALDLFSEAFCKFLYNALRNDA